MWVARLDRMIVHCTRNHNNIIMKGKLVKINVVERNNQTEVQTHCAWHAVLTYRVLSANLAWH